jgi:hypothetical protein
MQSAKYQLPNTGLPVSKPSIVNFVQSLIAVVAGNAVYFLLMPHLPPAARHDPARLDLGILVDFWFCVVFLGAIKTFTKWGGGQASRDKGT